MSAELRGADVDELPYGFEVVQIADPEEPEGWCVTLPHQCDSWDITGSRYDPVPHASAVAELKDFIAEALAALVRLEAREADEVVDS
jgi:hypothetical protein